MIVSLNKLSFSFGTNNIFEDVTFEIEENDKCGIIGVNGAGKTTLLKIIQNELISDSGEIFIKKGSKISYLKQNEDFENTNTIFGYLLDSFDRLIQMETEMTEIQNLLNESLHHDEHEKLSNKLSELEEKYSKDEGYFFRSKIKGVLIGLGFTQSQFDMEINALSGGQKTRLALCKTLLSNSDLLLLDEPTNHLDMESVSWLEEFVKSYPKAILMVSHDRYFLDQTSNKILEVRNKKVKMYKGNYTSFSDKKNKHLEINEKQFNNQQKEITRLEGIIEQQRRWNRQKNIKKAQSFQKKLDRFDELELDVNYTQKLRIRLETNMIGAKDVLTVKDISKSYGNKLIFDGVTFEVKRGDKVAILGSNGCGKSTLLKIISNKVSYDNGMIIYGSNIESFYFDQVHDNLDLSSNILEDIDKHSKDLNMTQLRTILGGFLFKGDDVFKVISSLSGGEKSRVEFVKMILRKPNFIVLDEPTNHIDIDTKEVLEDVLYHYEGTILFVSHDRYFVNKLANVILDFENKNFRYFRGSYSDFKDYKTKFNHTIENNPLEKKSADTKSRFDYINQKEKRALEKKLEREIENTEHRIEELEKQIEDINEKMGKDEVQSNHERLSELFKHKEGLELELEGCYNKWEYLNNKVAK